MKIISKFHDYYDSVLAYGHDDSAVFVRERVEFKDLKLNIIQQLCAMLGYKGYDYHRYITRYSPFKGKNNENHVVNYNFTNIEIVFCGHAYRGIESYNNNGRWDFFYDKNDFLKFIKENNIDIQEDHHKKINLDPYFGEITVDETMLIENKISIAVRRGKSLVINDCLADYKFYKIFDAYSAFQKLDAWVSGVLAYPPNFMIEIDDRYKVGAHGFDTKYGFRKRPTKEKN